MSVFVLMTGMYDTYGLENVYSTKEAAETAGRIHQGDGNGDFESAWEVIEKEVIENVGMFVSSIVS